MPDSERPRIRIGVGGWTYEPWRGSFFPADLPQNQDLGFASRKLTSIEVNGTYYRTQKPDTFAKWHDETPEGFVFSLKAPRYVTNRRVLAEAEQSIERFFASGVTRLGDKLGPINWQFTPNKKFDPDDFAGFLRLLPTEVEGRAIRHAVEVRHDSFWTPAFVALARDHGVAIVIAGDSDYPLIADLTAPFVYVRIMGTTEAETVGYSDDSLDLWASRALGWVTGRVVDGMDTVTANHRGEGRDVFIYVISGFKERNPAAAMALSERITSAQCSPGS